MENWELGGIDNFLKRHAFFPDSEAFHNSWSLLCGHLFTIN